MNDDEIKELILTALEKLKHDDAFLLEHDLNEQCISHKFAEILQPLFFPLNVDCEYNGNVQDPLNRKRIYILKGKLEKLGLLKERETESEGDYADRSVFPDIIIHRRGQTENYCIIEVKKNSSKVKYDYDFLKLECYTLDMFGNQLGYQLGVFVELIVGNEIGYNIKYYKNGEEIE